MTTRSTVMAFVATFLLAWSALGSTAAAQHEPMHVERASEVSSAAPTHHAHAHAAVQIDEHGPRLNASRIFGWVLLPVGGVGIAGSLVLTLIGGLVQHPLCWSECSGHDATPWFVGAGVSGALGALALVSGIALVASSPTWDEANVANLRVAIAPTEGGAIATVGMDF